MERNPIDAGAAYKQLTSLMPDKTRGKLKIFIGYAPGVGKTCAMLRAGHEEKKNGTDVVAGYIDPQERPDTAALLKGLEMLPHTGKSNDRRGFKEFDLVHALHRNPDLILVDDLAHTNAPTLRHKKRYQDVEELLRAGIHVYTTINVQEIESLADIVSSITGESVHDSIPDSVFDRADQIELVDIEPDALIERLKKGEIYSNQETERVHAHLFTKEKLNALREIALRTTAAQLNRSSSNIKTGININVAKDHILVCLSPSTSNKKVIRTAARMAEAFHSQFTALFVETQEINEATEKDKTELRENFRLAEQLGAKIATVYGDDIPSQIAEYVKMSRVSKIVIGRSPNKKKGISKPTVVDKLIDFVPNVETYIIPYAEPMSTKKAALHLKSTRVSLVEVAKTAFILLGCTLIGLWFHNLGFREANIITVYILGVLLVAMVTEGKMYSVFSSIMSVLVFNFFFTEPYYSLQANDSGYPLTFFIMLLASFIMSTLTTRVREQARHSAHKAYRTEVLLETNRKLQQAKDSTEIINETAHQMVKLLDRTIIFYSIRNATLCEPLIFPKKERITVSQLYTGENEQAVAEWVYKNNKRAGATTDTFSNAYCLYHAVREGETVFAVAAIVMDQEESLGIFEKNLMIAMLGECALALEKERLNEKQKEISLQVQQEQLRVNLLRGISHDLRTPLTSISGNAGILVGNSKALNEEQKKNLYTDIYDEAKWLIHLVENLLSISRIEHGKVNLSLQAELIEEVFAEALLHLNRNSEYHTIRTELEGEWLMARMDSRLIIQVLINLLDNAIKYTQPGSHITLSAKQENEMILVEVSDDGPGIAEEAKLRIFDMFYTADQTRIDGRRGLGLGLSLCKSIVNAHGGTIGIRDRVPNGAVFYFTLQAEEVSVYE